eukprot:4062359-Pyramimonas_sp.AAC.1
MVRAAAQASTSYGSGVMGATGTELREARFLQASVQSQKLAGRSVTLLLQMAGVKKVDPAFKLCAAPLLHLADAVWESWAPAPLILPGLDSAQQALDNTSVPWRSVRGPFTSCVASARRLGIAIEGLVFSHESVGRFSLLELCPRA